MNAHPKSGEYIWPQAKSPSGKIHEVMVVKRDGITTFHPACNENFDLAIDGWFKHWKGVRQQVTCAHCIRICNDGRR